MEPTGSQLRVHQASVAFLVYTISNGSHDRAWEEHQETRLAWSCCIYILQSHQHGPSHHFNSSAIMTIHQRTTSNSFRISIPGSPSRDRPVHLQSADREQPAASAASRRDRQHQHHQYHGHSTSTSYSQSERKRDAWSASNAAHPRQPAGTFSVRLTRRQLAILLGSLLALIVLLRSARSNPSDTSKTSLKTNTRAKNVKNRKGPFTSDGVPIVDRGVLFNRIRQIEQEGVWEDEDEDEARSAGRLPIKYNPAQPAVFQIPDGKPRNRPKITEADLEYYRRQNLQEASNLDKEYCPDQTGGCKFLLPAWLGEQETKAQMHLYQLGLLAISLNRTLVLPNVSKSRMMSCASQPFDFYYDATSLEQLGIPTISFSRFTEWTSKRLQEPTSQIVAVASPSNDWSTGALEIDPSADPSNIPSLPKRKLCLDPPKAYLNFTSYSPITVHPPSNWHKQEDSRLQFGESLINTLSSIDVRQKSLRIYDDRNRLLRWFTKAPSQTSVPPSPDVLVFNYELRYPILHHDQLQAASFQAKHPLSHADIMKVQEFRHFDYAPIWTNLALQVVSSLSPFVAIHWRQETLPTDIISPCGEALIDELEHLILQLQQHQGKNADYGKIKTVYLATDYPIEDLENGWDGAVAHSGTFGKLLTEEHHSAMRNFLKHFRKRLTEPLGVRLTTFSKEQANLKLSEELLKAITPSADTGRQAINDRNGRPRKKNLQPKVPKTGLDLADLDIGLLGIIDKTVAMHAEIFITGLPWSSSKELQAIACAKESSFTKQISDARKMQRSKTDDLQDDVATGRLWSESCFGTCLSSEHR